MALNKQYLTATDLLDRNQSSAHTNTARYKPLLAAHGDAHKKRFSDTPIDGLRLVPTNGRSDTSSGYINNRFSFYSRPRKKRTLDTGTTENSKFQGTEQGNTNAIISRPVTFDWPVYLKEICALPVPASFFVHLPQELRIDFSLSNGFSDGPSLPVKFSNFEVDQYLEGIDPHHESLFCVLKVAEVVGRRLRLRFVGYPEKYDFWVLADSPFLFPAGWCAHNNRRLQPPKSYVDRGQTDFKWEKFLKRENGVAAPRKLFRVPWDCNVSEDNQNHSFRIGDKLEAVDKRNPTTVCVATIKDCIGNYLLIRFDGWESNFDQWVHISSELLHPVGFCEDQELVLSIPSEWSTRPGGFTWKQYLKETHSKQVPVEAFQRPSSEPRLSQLLQVGQRLEAVDRRCPQLIRVAHVAAVTQAGFVTIAFDGWSEKLNVFLEASYIGLLPVGYCQATGHPLQPPPGYEQDNGMANDGNSGGDSQSNLSSSTTSSSISTSGTSSTVTGSTCCPTPGCKGYGHIKGPRFSSHQRISGCPYADTNLRKDFVRGYDRLAYSNVLPIAPDSTLKPSKIEESGSRINCDNQQHPAEAAHPFSPDSSGNVDSSPTPPPLVTTSSNNVLNSTNSKLHVLSPVVTPSGTVPDRSSDVVSTSGHHSNSPVDVEPDGLSLSSGGSGNILMTSDMNCPISVGIKGQGLVDAHHTLHSSENVASPVVSQGCNTPLVPLDLSLDRPVDNTITDSNSVLRPKQVDTVPLTSATPVGTDLLGRAEPTLCHTADQNIQMDVTNLHSVITTVTAGGISKYFEEPSSNLGNADKLSFSTNNNFSMPDAVQYTTAYITNSKRPSKQQAMKWDQTKTYKQMVPQISTDYQLQQSMTNIAGIPVRRKRGRPRKVDSPSLNVLSTAALTVPSSRAPTPRQRSNPPQPAPAYPGTYAAVLITGQHSQPSMAQFGHYSTTPPTSSTYAIPALATTALPANSQNDSSSTSPPHVSDFVHKSEHLNKPSSTTTSLPNFVNDLPGPTSSASHLCVNHCLSNDVQMIENIVSTPASDSQATNPSVYFNEGSGSGNMGIYLPMPIVTMDTTESISTAQPTPPTSAIHNTSLLDPVSMSLTSTSGGGQCLASSNRLLPASLAAWCAADVRGPPVPSFCQLQMGHSRLAPPALQAPQCPLYSSGDHHYPIISVSGLSKPCSMYQNDGKIDSVDLLNRLLPQAGAALQAARAAGLAGPHSWSVEMVGHFVATLPGCTQFACKFIDNEIDGAALLCLEQHDLMQILGMKLGPAVKVSSAIQTLRRGLLTTPLSELSADHSGTFAAAASCFNLTVAATTSSSAGGDSLSGSTLGTTAPITNATVFPSPVDSRSTIGHNSIIPTAVAHTMPNLGKTGTTFSENLSSAIAALHDPAIPALISEEPD